MADIQKLYEQWLAKATADPDLKAELESIKNDEDGKNDRFYRDLEVCAELSAQAPTE